MDVPSELLRAARAALGMKQSEVASLAGLVPRTVMRIENSDPTVSLDTRRQLQRAFLKVGIQFTPAEADRGPGLIVRRDLIKQQNLDF